MFNDLSAMVKMMIFSNIKTNSFIETMFMIGGFIFLTYLYNLINNSEINIYNISDQIKSLFYKKNVLGFEGKRCTSVAFDIAVVSCTFTDRFKAVWDEIIQNISKNTSIVEVRELVNEMDRCNNDENEKNNELNSESLFIVSQKKKFVYNKELEIYGLSEVLLAEDNLRDNKDNNNNNNIKNKIDRIIITLFSYKTSLNDMIRHVDQVTEKYMDSIEKSRINKKFIYTINKTRYEDNSYECWLEHPFESARTFENIFFKEKEDVIKKINFFIENKQWYYEMGIPYTLGLGLHGPPGTGKTSLIKSIANMTNRHIVILSLKMIKTRSHLMQFFFEERYNQKNKKNSIDFNNKIIVIEDIDCAGDIILKRGGSSEENNKKKSKDVKVEDVLLNLMENQKQFEEEKYQNKYRGGSRLPKPTNDDDLLTLDDILNLWDGIKETPGRIMIISSNHYDLLDTALTRPGRIDITIELNNASREIIAQMFQKFYKTTINKKQLEKINDVFYSPAEIINLFVLHMNDSKKFMERLMENKKLL